MSYFERICTGSFRVTRRTKRRRILIEWSASSGWGQEIDFIGSEQEQEHSKEPTAGFFKINSSKRLRVFIDDGDGLFQRTKDDLLTTHKLSRRERRSFNQSDVGTSSVDFISWHLPPELCTQSECHGSDYNILINPDESDAYVSLLINSQQGELLRGACLG